jgi:hypothetical protein
MKTSYLTCIKFVEWLRHCQLLGNDWSMELIDHYAFLYGVKPGNGV